GNVFTEFRPQHWNHSHFFLVSRVNSRDFIFDPTGVPTDYSREIETITPYFGLLESASGNHRLVYDKKTPMDDWGTR
ncbi:MAG: hypothetical protein WCK29_03845, partial [archaeon]